MVSTNDTAKQVQFSSLKQDSAEAAFKARHSFGSSDAFRQIFDGIDKSSQPAAPVKEAVAEPIKSDAPTKAHGKHHGHHSKHIDTAAKKSDDVKQDTTDDSSSDTTIVAKSTNDSDKYAQLKKADKKTQATDNDDDKCEDDKCEDKSAQATDEPTDTAVTKTTAVAEPTDASKLDYANTAAPVTGEIDDQANIAQTAETDVADDSAETAQPSGDSKAAATPNAIPLVAVNLPSPSNTDTDVSDDSAETAQPSGDSKAAATPNAIPLVVANLPPASNDDATKTISPDIKGAAPIIGDFQKAVNVHQKSTPQKSVSTKTDDIKTATLDQDAAAFVSDDAFSDDAFSDGVEAKAEPAKDPQIETPKENASDKHQAIKAAKEKHADHIELLQGKFSAPGTHPAAGDRAISAALTASDSPAPTPNGSAGGGSPITAKDAAATNAVTGLEGLHPAQGDQVTFAGTLRNVKEAQASLMLPNEQVAVHLNRMAKSGMSQYDLQLHPADLGRVDIRLEIAKDGTVQATVTADNQQTFDMLQKDSRSLERALQQAGLQTDSGSLSFNLRGDGQNTAQQQAQQNSGNPWNKWMEKTLPDEVVQSKVLSFDVGTGNGRVDLRI
ncbi:MAG: flagellar hook-length control protein FliK [Alphaproteobacteria bacterium]|nr:flagellar hook-length control protein FliK [Alphaproteobacteria bacterium]